MDQALLGYSPVVVAPLADSSSKLAEALEVLAGDLFEQFHHMGINWSGVNSFISVHSLAFYLAITPRNFVMATCHSSRSKEPIWAAQQQPMKWVMSRFHTEAT